MNTCLKSEAFYRILKRKRVHHSCKHAYIIRCSPIHLLICSSSPKIATAYYYPNLYSKSTHFFNFLCNAYQRFFIYSKVLITCKCFTAHLKIDIGIGGVLATLIGVIFPELTPLFSTP